MSSNFVFRVEKRTYNSRNLENQYHCCICNKKLKGTFDYNSVIHDTDVTKIGWVCSSEKCVAMFIFRNM